MSRHGRLGIGELREGTANEFTSPLGMVLRLLVLCYRGCLTIFFGGILSALFVTGNRPIVACGKRGYEGMCAMHGRSCNLHQYGPPVLVGGSSAFHVLLVLFHRS